MSPLAFGSAVMGITSLAVRGPQPLSRPTAPTAWEAAAGPRADWHHRSHLPRVPEHEGCCCGHLIQHETLSFTAPHVLGSIIPGTA